MMVQLNEAYEHLSDDAKRREYDSIYRVIIGPSEIKKRKIAGLEKRVEQLRDQRRVSESSLRNALKDLVRLYVERDRIKEERESLEREIAIEERWWPYICSFVPGKAGEFTRQKRKRGRRMSDMIGKQRTKERNINRKEEEIRSFRGNIQSIEAAERKIKAEIRDIEEDWSHMISVQEMERVVAECRKQREQADRARAASEKHFTRTRRETFGYSNIWDF